MLLSKTDAYYAANVFEDFFANFDRIDDYMRKVKMERMSTFPASLPGMGPETDLFNKFDIHPKDMEFNIVPVTQSQFMIYMDLITSAPVEKSIPGKQMLLLIKEKGTGTVVGGLRFGSPTINSRPRNEFLGKPLDTRNADTMSRLNDSCTMLFNCVPVQPALGFNMLGGKLLAAIASSHYVRRLLNKKYGSNICMMETTSLYGDAKGGVSMYSGMKPILLGNGQTDSAFAPLINDQNFRKLNGWFQERNEGNSLVPVDASSRKLKTQQKMVSVIKASLKLHDIDAYDKFCKIYKGALDLTQRKNSYYSCYGYDRNSVKSYLNLERDTLIKADNWDRFELENIIEWWKNKAEKRYVNLKADGRLRTPSVPETWNVNPEDIDIIR